MASTKRSDGEGSLFEDKVRGRWVGVLVVGWRDGKPIRRKVSAKSRSAAATRLRELRDKVNAGNLPAGRVPTVAEWMTHWLDEIASAKVRPRTLAGYRRYVAIYINPLLGSHRLDRLTPEHVQTAWRRLTETGRPGAVVSKPLSTTTARQAHRILARALKVAQQRGYVQRNVATLIDAPASRDVEMTPLSKDQAQRILATARDTRLAARWSVALSLGLRQGEALGLQWQHVDLEQGAIHVRQALSRLTGQGLVFGPVKSRAGRRTVALPASLLVQLRAHRSAQNAERLAAGTWWKDHDLVFCQPDGRPIDPRADWQTWKDLLAKAGVPHRRLHDARHTAATLLLAQGIPTRVVMDILGHSQISVTTKYQHVLGDMQQAAADKMDSALWGS
jgi:integrase